MYDIGHDRYSFVALLTKERWQNETFEGTKPSHASTRLPDCGEEGGVMHITDITEGHEPGSDG
jgi:hypothetical protein